MKVIITRAIIVTYLLASTKTTRVAIDKTLKPASIIPIKSDKVKVIKI